MDISMKLITEIDSKLDRVAEPHHLRILLTFSTFLASLAELRLKERNKDNALEYHQMSNLILKKIIDLKKDFGPAYAHLGYYFVNHYTEPKQLEDSCKLLEIAHKSSFVDPDILTYWAKALHELGHHEEAFNKASLALKCGIYEISKGF